MAGGVYGVGARLDDLKPELEIRGIVAGQSVTIVQVHWHGTCSRTTPAPARR